MNPCALEGKAVPAPPCYSYIKSDKSVVGYKVVRYVGHIEIPVKGITPLGHIEIPVRGILPLGHIEIPVRGITPLGHI